MAGMQYKKIVESQGESVWSKGGSEGQWKSKGAGEAKEQWNAKAPDLPLDGYIYLTLSLS